MAKHPLFDRLDDDAFAPIEELMEFEDEEQLDDPEFVIAFRPDPALRRTLARRVLH